MQHTLFCPRLFDGLHMHSDVLLHIAADRVTAMGSGLAGDADLRLPIGSIIAPGLIDIQVNGGGAILFNAMAQFSARAPGVVGAALAAPHSCAGLVLDGHHVAAGSVAVMRAARGLDRIVLVSDATPPAGTTDTAFMLQGAQIRVTGGRCIDAAGTLAGAAITLADAVVFDAALQPCAVMQGGQWVRPVEDRP